MLQSLTPNERAGFIALAASIVSVWSLLGIIREVQAANCNQNCEDRWVTITEIANGIECHHSPENDPDCPDDPVVTVDCFEANGQVGDCNCFDCTISGTTCSNDIRVFRAWCGKEVTGYNEGDCPSHVVGQGVIRQERASFVSGGGACNYGNNGYLNTPRCGGGHDHTGCKSSNCQGSGTWLPAKTGDIEDCGAA